MLRRKRFVKGFEIGSVVMAIASLPTLAPALALGQSPSTISQRFPAVPPPSLNRPQACPTSFKSLVSQLLADLPSYANRTNVRSDLPHRYLILASQPEFKPLPVTSTPHSPESDDQLRQVFFTTLVRRYQGNQSTDIQEYHWLFLAHNPKGWWFSMMHSIIGSYPQAEPPSPPRNSSEGKLAQAIRLWLRDCRARDGRS